MTEEETNFIKRYRLRLGRAWTAGMDDRRAARYVGVKEEELERVLNSVPEFKEYRDRKVDKLLIKAQENIAEKINAGDVKTSEWYWEKIRKNESKMLDMEDEEQDASDIDDFLDSCTAKKVSFDE